MLYRILIILFLFSQIISQSLFNRIMPEEYYIGDTRSKGIGHTYLSNGRTSMLSLSNPARIAKMKNHVFDIQTNLLSITERKSMIVLDGWGEFLAETDYVNNQTNLLNHSFGILYKVKRKFGLAFVQAPLFSLNYNYEEEVRADSDPYDGIIDIRDPLIGFHTYSTTGDLIVQSLGFGFRQRNVAIGLSINKIKPFTIKDQVFVNVIDQSYYESNNMVDNIENFTTHHRVNPSSQYYIASLDVKVNKHLDFIFSYQEGLDGDYSDLEISNQIGLPLLFDKDDNDSPLEYLIGSLKYAIPEKTQLGFLYNSKNNSKISIAFEVTRKKWNYSNPIPIFDNSTNEFRFGFEYDALFGFPVRAGLVYSESQLTMIDPKSIITLGTAKKFNRVVMDFALSNMNFDFKYYDLFTDEDIFSMGCDDADCDKIKENQLNLLTTIRVNFK